MGAQGVPEQEVEGQVQGLLQRVALPPAMARRSAQTYSGGCVHLNNLQTMAIPRLRSVSTSGSAASGTPTLQWWLSI